MRCKSPTRYLSNLCVPSVFFCQRQEREGCQLTCPTDREALERNKVLNDFCYKNDTQTGALCYLWFVPNDSFSGMCVHILTPRGQKALAPFVRRWNAK